MKYKIIFACLLILASLSIQAQNEKLRIAVFDPTSSGTGIDEGTKMAVREIISSTFVNTGKYTIVERSLLEKVMSEQAFSNSGAVNDSQAAEIGRLAGANKIVLSVVTLAGGRNMLSIKLVDVNTANVERQKTQIITTDELLAVVEPLTMDLMGEQMTGVRQTQISGARNSPPPAATQPARQTTTTTTTRAARTAPAARSTRTAPAARSPRGSRTTATTEQTAPATESINPPNDFGIEMVYVEGSGRTRGFFIGKYEITQAQWLEIMGINPSVSMNDAQPVENVSWQDAQEFIIKLNDATGRNYRLPTSSEWLYAANGGRNRKNFKFAGSNNIFDVGWFSGNNTGEGPQRVGAKLPNSIGIHDMTGNVSEWCQEASKASHIIYGGSWNNPEKSCTLAASRSSFGGQNGNIGFRIVLSE